MRIQKQLEQAIGDALAPQHLELVNESHQHSVPEGSESHFNATIVSGAFAGKSRIQRHRAVYAAIGADLQQQIHAFTMKTLTPEEWEAAGQKVDNTSPQCLGGSKHDKT
jgi:stress-induced morphogen